jgi:hypothetical protein
VITQLTVASHGAWSLGVLIGVPLLGVILLVLLGFALWCLVEAELGVGLSALGVAGVIVGVALSPLGYYPYGAEYHQWRDVSGVVADTGSRFLPSSDGKATEQKIVVRYAGSDLDFGCQDTRCALVKKGDTLDLRCKRTWQYQSVSGYDCRFVSRRAGG